MTEQEPGRRLRPRIAVRLLGLIAATLVLPSLGFFWASRQLVHKLGSAQADAERSYQEVERAAEGASKNVDRLIALNVLGVTSAVAGHLEFLFETSPELVEHSEDLTENQQIWQLLISQRLGPTTRVALLDHRKQTMVAHPQCSHGSSLESCMPLVKRLIADSGYLGKLDAAWGISRTLGQAPGMAYQRLMEHGFYEGSDGSRSGGGTRSRHFVVLTPLRGTPWSLAIESRALGVFSAVYEDVNAAIGKTAGDLRRVGTSVDAARGQQSRILVGIVALGAVLLVLSGWWLRRTVLNPLATLRATADRIRGGDLETRAVLHTGDEIEILANSMNFMLGHLTSSYRALQGSQADLSELNASLEERVAERTAELSRLNDQLHARDELRRRFYANVSHELRTPLTLILGLLRAIAIRAGKKGDTIALRDVATAERNAAHLLREINDLLDMSRLEAGKMTLQAAPVVLDDLVHEVVTDSLPAVARGGRRLTMEMPGEPQRLYLDPDRIRKVVYNLLSNAVKFTDERTGVIRVSVRPVDPDGVALEVADNGAGIPEASLPYIFDRFHQAENAATRRYEGTGIGLALVKEIAELHGGRVEVWSRPGEGTRFSVIFRTGQAHLPAAEVRDRAAPSQAVTGLHRLLFAATPDAAEEPAPDEVAPEGAPSILVVEDHGELREYLVRLLGSTYRVRVASDGAEALERIGEAAPDVILSDVMMPRMDGYALCAAVKQDPETRHIPVVLLTAQAGLAAKLRGLESQADDYLQKPFAEEELLARVKNLLVIRQQAAALRAQATALQEVNQRLEVRVLEQADVLSRRGRLQRFLPPAVVDELLEHDPGVALERKRRVVAVLSAELCDFDQLAGAMEPEDLTVLFGRFHTLTTEVVFRHAGTLAGLSGGSLLAVFGAPREVSEAEAAEAAVRAGRALLECIETLAESWRELAAGQPLLLRGGVDLGNGCGRLWRRRLGQLRRGGRSGGPGAPAARGGGEGRDPRQRARRQARGRRRAALGPAGDPARWAGAGGVADPRQGPRRGIDHAPARRRPGADAVRARSRDRPDGGEPGGPRTGAARRHLQAADAGCGGRDAPARAPRAARPRGQDARGALPGGARARPGRHGHGLRGPGFAARAAHRDQALAPAAARHRHRAPAAGGSPRASGHAPERVPRVRPPDPRRHRLRDDGARPGALARRHPARAIGARRGGPRVGAPDLRRAHGRARLRHRAPRPQARQRAGRGHGPGGDRGLRARPPRGRPHAGRDGRHARLHGAGTDQRQQPAGRALGHLLARRAAVPAVHGRPALRRRAPDRPGAGPLPGGSARPVHRGSLHRPHRARGDPALPRARRGRALPARARRLGRARQGDLRPGRAGRCPVLGTAAREEPSIVE